MSDLRIVYTRPDDNGLSIIVPAPGISIEEAAKAVPFGVAYTIIKAEEVPQDRTFRNAWKLGE